MAFNIIQSIGDGGSASLLNPIEFTTSQDPVDGDILIFNVTPGAAPTRYVIVPDGWVGNYTQLTDEGTDTTQSMYRVCDGTESDGGTDGTTFEFQVSSNATAWAGVLMHIGGLADEAPILLLATTAKSVGNITAPEITGLTAGSLLLSVVHRGKFGSDELTLADGYALAAYPTGMSKVCHVSYKTASAGTALAAVTVTNKTSGLLDDQYSASHIAFAPADAPAAGGGLLQRTNLHFLGA